MTALREFDEETRYIFHSLHQQLSEQLVEYFPGNLVYSADGKYVTAFVEVPYLDDAQKRFKSGLKVEDTTLALEWVPVKDLLGGTVRVPFSNSRCDLTAVPLSGLLQKLLKCTPLYSQSTRSIVAQFSACVFSDDFR